MLSIAAADAASSERTDGRPTVVFDIPTMTAKDALMQFAQQTSTPLLVSFELVESIEANALIGEFTVAEGLHRLLAGTGLVGSIERGVIGVRLDPGPEQQNVIQNGGNPNMLDSKTTRTSLLKRLGTALTTAIFATSGSVALAESPDKGERYIEEIIVTAEKREESILDVPVSMTALSGDKLEELGLTNIFDLEQQVPGLQFGDDNEQKGHGTVIRGIGTFSLRIIHHLLVHASADIVHLLMVCDFHAQHHFSGVHVGPRVAGQTGA